MASVQNTVNIFPKSLIGFYWGLAKKFWLFLTSVIILGALNSVIANVLPSASIKWLSDAIEASDAALPIAQQVMPVVILISVLLIVQYVTEWATGYIDGQYTPLVRAKAEEIVFDKLGYQSVAFFKDNASGYLVEQSGHVIGKFLTICRSRPREVLVLIFSLATTGGIMFTVHWSILVLFAFCAIFRLSWCSATMRRMVRNWVLMAVTSARLKSKYIDSISNFMNIKLLARKDGERLYFNKARLSYAKIQQNSNKVERQFWLFPYGIQQGCNILLLLLLVHLYSQGIITVGDIAFSFTAFATMMGMITSITWKFPEIIEDFSIAGQAYEAIAQPVSIFDSPSPRRLCDKNCGIEFKNITFGYGGIRVFAGFNLCVSAGEKVGIVGAPGSGKSTILYLLMRLYEIQKGSIKIDGIDIRESTMDSLRGIVSFVPQDCTLFDRTIKENIAYGASGATTSDVIQAAKKASAHDFIMKMEDGYNTTVGERGAKLTAGQRQRIGIAHAICKDAQIVVMDEATTAMDSKTEEAFEKSLPSILRGKTALVVAHRVSTLKHMDRIIVLENGKIAEEGTHSELIKNTNGVYYKMWKSQEEGFM